MEIKSANSADNVVNLAWSAITNKKSSDLNNFHHHTTF